MCPRRKPTGGFTLIEFMVVVVVLVVLAAMLLPAMPRGKEPVSRVHCTNNLRRLGLAYRQFSTDHGDRFPTAVPVSDGGALESVLASDVASVFRLLSNHLETPKILFCPADKRRTQATTFATVLDKGDRRSVPFLNNSNVSYFVGLDATPSAWQTTLLAGDDNWLTGGRPAYNGTGYNGSPAKPGLLLLETNTLIAWSEERHAKQGKVALSDGSVQGWSSSKLAEGLRSTGLATNRFMFP